jgi:hypothetical protein
VIWGQFTLHSAGLGRRLSVALDRTHKAQAPEPLKPTNRFGSPQESLKHFIESRQKTIDFLNQHNDLRTHTADSPLGKKLDAYEWVPLSPLTASATPSKSTK